jgi:putative transposase
MVMQCSCTDAKCINYVTSRSTSLSHYTPAWARLCVTPGPARDADLAKRQLERLAHSLERAHPSAARSLKEGLEETLTLTRLGIDGALYNTLRTTNPIENLNGLIVHYVRNVKRWRDGSMLERWLAAAVLEVARGFRKIQGYRDLRRLVTALSAHVSHNTQPHQRKVA